MSPQTYHLLIALLGVLAFGALLYAAAYLSRSAPGLAALAGGGAVAVAAGGLYVLLNTLAKA